jgi:hypothetical protein
MVVLEDRKDHGDRKAMARERWQGEMEKDKTAADEATRSTPPLL